MTFIGIDPGLRYMGIALVDGEHAETALFETRPDDGSEADRVQDLAQALHNWIGDRPNLYDTEETVVVGIEAEHFQQVRYKANPTERDWKAEAAKAGSTLRVAQVAGAVMAVAATFGLRVVEVSPAEGKIATTGNSAASKQQVWEMVCKRFGLKRINYHQADAVGVALGAERIVKREKLEALTGKERQEAENGP